MFYHHGKNLQILSRGTKVAIFLFLQRDRQAGRQTESKTNNPLGERRGDQLVRYTVTLNIAAHGISALLDWLTAVPMIQLPDYWCSYRPGQKLLGNTNCDRPWWLEVSPKKGCLNYNTEAVLCCHLQGIPGVRCISNCYVVSKELNYWC